MSDAIPWFLVFAVAAMAAWIARLFVEWIDGLLVRLDVEVEP